MEIQNQKVYLKVNKYKNNNNNSKNSYDEVPDYKDNIGGVLECKDNNNNNNNNNLENIYDEVPDYKDNIGGVLECKDNNNNNNNSENIYDEVPDYIIMEWELLTFIINYTLMLYIKSKYVSFSYHDIEYEYEKLYNYPCDIVEIISIKNYDNDDKNKNKKKTEFVKKYGKNGLYLLLNFRKGVTYNSEKKLWSIQIKNFLHSLKKEYIKDKNKYGKDFDKPWTKNLYF